MGSYGADKVMGQKNFCNDVNEAVENNVYELNIEEVAERIMAALKKEHDKLEKLNVMILGKTGVGKSTLINNMFNRKMAETGIGKPVTDQIQKIEIPNFPLAIYDTPGLELGGENSTNMLLKGVVKEMEQGARSGDPNKAIHCIWYCVSSTSHRFEKSEIDFLDEFLDQAHTYSVPVIIVLTQSYNKKDTRKLMTEIESEHLDIVKIVPVLAEEYNLDDEYVAKAYGLDTLSEIMNNVIPDALKKTFAAVQRVNLELKKRVSQSIVAASAVTAAATGAVPIPFADAVLLVPEQVTMLASITAAFGIPVEKGMLMEILSATIGTTSTTLMGKATVAGLLKLIPGVGTIVGATISGATAAALTAALGSAYIIVLTQVIKGEMSISDMSTDEGKKIITGIFTEQLKIKRDAMGNPL